MALQSTKSFDKIILYEKNCPVQVHYKFKTKWKKNLKVAYQLLLPDHQYRVIIHTSHLIYVYVQIYTYILKRDELQSFGQMAMLTFFHPSCGHLDFTHYTHHHYND